MKRGSRASQSPRDGELMICACGCKKKFSKLVMKPCGGLDDDGLLCNKLCSDRPCWGKCQKHIQKKSPASRPSVKVKQSDSRTPVQGKNDVDQDRRSSGAKDGNDVNDSQDTFLSPIV